MQRDKPTNIPQLIHRLNDDKLVYQLKERAIADLLEAICAVRHHQKPSKKIVEKLKEIQPEWHTWVNNGNEAKFEHWKLSISGNGLESNDTISFSTGYEADWEKLFAEIRRYDFSKQVAQIELTLGQLDNLMAQELKAVEWLRELKNSIPFQGQYSYVVQDLFPHLFTTADMKLGPDGDVVATLIELKRLGIEEHIEGQSGEVIRTKDGRLWNRGGNMGWGYYKLQR